VNQGKTAPNGKAEDDCYLLISGSHPNCGVILGSKEPDAFKRYLVEQKDEPLLAAKGLLGNAMRTLTDLPPVGPDLIQAIWDNDKPWFWNLTSAISLAAGDYRFESGFYSAPDASAKISQKTLRKAMEEPEKYALVFLDYHL
jgi:hypothetical protein